MKSPRCLLVVDVQYDFLPGGALAVPEGDAVIPIVRRLQDSVELVVATQDWHPREHKSFAVNHPDGREGAVVTIRGVTQVLWPVHCVEFSRGAEIAEEIREGRISHVVRKGTNVEVDSYSAFFDNGRYQQTGLDAYLRGLKVREVFVCGLATEYCVKFTTLDAIALGYTTFVLVDACRGINGFEAQKAMAEMRQAGVSPVRSALLTSAAWTT